MRVLLVLIVMFLGSVTWAQPMESMMSVPWDPREESKPPLPPVLVNGGSQIGNWIYTGYAFTAQASEPILCAARIIELILNTSYYFEHNERPLAQPTIVAMAPGHSRYYLDYEFTVRDEGNGRNYFAWLRLQSARSNAEGDCTCQTPHEFMGTRVTYFVLKDDLENLVTFLSRRRHDLSPRPRNDGMNGVMDIAREWLGQ